MGIFRGPGGTGDATVDASNEATLALAAAQAAELSKNDAANSAAQAATSASNASTSAGSASSSATSASNSASNALTSANNAANAEAGALNSASLAATSETNAASSASAAAVSAANALVSANNASSSASNAATSATNSANSALAASTSASNAAISESNASTSELNASNSASSALSSENAASASASTASTQATNASNSASAAFISETNAANSASAASTSASNASNSESAASISESNAANSASAASTSASNAAISETNAANLYDEFDDRYLGAKASDPTLDNDGNALITGALYFNTVDNVIKVYDGATWLTAFASLSGALFSSNNLSDVSSTTLARQNLGVEIGVNVQAYDTDLAAFALKTAPTGNVVGTSDTQTLTNKTINGASNTISNINLASQVTGTLPVANGGTGVTTSTGSGNNVLSTSPTLVTPALGTPSSGNLANCTFPTLNQNTTGNAATATNPQSGGSFITSSNIGTQSVNFANSATNATNADNVTGVQTTFGTAGSGQNTNSGGQAGPQVLSNGGGGAVWSMHRPGAFGLNIGLDSDNVFRIGGWSAGANRMQLDMSGNFTVPGTVTAPTFSGNATTATNLSTNQSNWSTNGTISAVVGQLAWRNYGNGHTIFDASASVSPSGGGVNNTNAEVPWSGTLPTLMGWNGGNTFGVRVDSARVSDALSTVVGSAPSYACRAWVNFDGANGNIRSSGNVSSITRNGNNDYTVNFSSAMPNANYSVNFGITQNGPDGSCPSIYATADGGAPTLMSTTQIRVRNARFGGANTVNSNVYCVSIFC
jgi:hypothetical protein